ncbi:unnamed protein product, partial [Didymodactylos carnosus]
VDAGCLAGDGLVYESKSGLYKRVYQLKSGDIVHTMYGESEVIMISDNSNEKYRLICTPSIDLFTTIETETGYTISLTPHHLIPVFKNGIPTFVHADRVHLNDFVYSSDGLISLKMKVKAIKHEIKVGYYSPITADGTILVNKIVASVYARINNHHVAHFSNAPMRWYYRIMKYFKVDEPFYTSANGQKHWTHGLLIQLGKTLIPQLFV